MSLELALQKNNELLEALNANFTRLLAFSVSTPEAPAVEAPAKPKAVKAPKAEVTATVEAEVAQENVKAAASPAVDAPIHYDTVKTATLAAVKDKGRDAVEAVLKQHGVTKAPELKPEQYDAYLAALKNL